MSWCNVSYV